MGMGYKYIMLDKNTPIIFPAHIEHVQMARAMATFKATMFPTSAGFIDGLMIEATSGKSISLDIDSKDDDKKIINDLDNCYGKDDF